jgi:hypothetical protein
MDQNQLWFRADGPSKKSLYRQALVAACSVALIVGGVCWAAQDKSQQSQSILEQKVQDNLSWRGSGLLWPAGGRADAVQKKASALLRLSRHVSDAQLTERATQTKAIQQSLAEVRVTSEPHAVRQAEIEPKQEDDLGRVRMEAALDVSFVNFKPCFISTRDF